MRVEKIVPSQKVKERFYIELEDGGTIRATTAQIADFALYAGRELSDGELEELRGEAESANARARALRILGARQLSRAEMIRRLVEKGERGAVAEETADWLEKIGALDDAEYARAIARHYAARGYGARRIESELYRRRVPREHWDAALAERGAEEDDKARAFIASRLRGAAEPDRAEKKRVSDALARRGFSWDEISAAWARYSEDLEDGELD